MSCVQGLCVAAKKERERKNKKKKFLLFKKNLAVEKKVLPAETKERARKNERLMKSEFFFSCVTTFVSRLASLSKV
jgi:hypothetical protein